MFDIHIDSICLSASRQINALKRLSKFLDESSRLLIYKSMMTSSNGNIFRVTGLRWIPRTKASDADLWCFLDLCLNKRLRKQSWGWWFETLSCSLWRHCNAFVLSTFSYSPITWIFCANRNNLKLEKLQERALRFVFSDFTSTYEELLKRGHFLPLSIYRLKFLEVYKCVNNLNPPYLNNLFITKI